MDATFETLLKSWSDETGVFSSFGKIMDHPAARKVVRMGEEAVPALVEELREGRGHVGILGALQEITGANPIAEEDRGRIPKMSSAWVEWFDANNAPAMAH